MFRYTLPLTLIACLTAFNLTAFAQNNENQTDVSIAASGENLGDSIFENPEVQPQFPQGMQALYNHIGNNLVYPKNAEEGNIQGKTTIRFVVEKDGSIGEAALVQGFDPQCDSEAMRIIKSLPKFIPGRQKGKVVRTYYNITINFALKEKKLQLPLLPDDAYIMVDGTRITTEEMYKLNPDSIKSINILRDESATRIYGAKGKSIVVLISLKKEITPQNKISK
jgi:TonB family protein